MLSSYPLADAVPSNPYPSLICYGNKFSSDDPECRSLFSHSQFGGSGWYTVMKNDKVRAVVAFESGSQEAVFFIPGKAPPANPD
ncbi:hypothetical protein BWR12_09050 [Citrobacter braakii]|jgi:hypothetical protein|nr:hypothetical protein BWR12_09050 [Citrobacter braakii]